MFSFIRKKRDDCKLLPHIRQNIYGLNRSMQFMPWPLLAFDIPKYWNNSTGKGIIVAVLDTGCDYNHIDISSNIINGWNIIENNNNFMDDNGHGTHVAGTIAASNNTLGVVGVAPEAKIMPVKVLNRDGSGSNIDVANGILWALENNADIITMSLGSEQPSKQIEKAIQYASSKNVPIFCAAGNSGNHVDIQYPAKYKETISIGAIDKDLKICDFSCTGQNLDFVAPGQDIPSCVPKNQYAIMSGTSMANPYAVGCAAICLYSIRRTSPNKNLSKEEYIKILSRNAKHVSQREYINNKRYEGNGIVQPALYIV